MKQFFNLLLVTACAATLLGGCKGKDGAPGPTGATGATGAVGAAGASGQNLTGNIIGYVNPVDESGSSLNKSGVVVSIDGANPAITATSNGDGRYELTNVRNGTYNLTYTRSGLATFRRYGVGHVGGDQPTYLYTSDMSQVSTQRITALSVNSSQSSDYLLVNYTIASPTPTSSFQYLLFASTTATATPSTATLISADYATTQFPSYTYRSNSYLSKANLTRAGFASGTTVYLTAYGSTNYSATYTDPSTGRTVYPALNTTASPVVTITAP